MDITETLARCHDLLAEATTLLRTIEERTRVAAPPGPKRTRTPSAEVTHGTKAMYERHLREGTPPCEKCRAANAEIARRKRAAARLL